MPKEVSQSTSVDPTGSLHSFATQIAKLHHKWIKETEKKLAVLRTLRSAANIIGNNKLESEIKWREERVLQQQDCYWELGKLISQSHEPRK